MDFDMNDLFEEQVCCKCGEIAEGILVLNILPNIKKKVPLCEECGSNFDPKEELRKGGIFEEFMEEISPEDLIEDFPGGFPPLPLGLGLDNFDPKEAFKSLLSDLGEDEKNYLESKLKENINSPLLNGVIEDIFSSLKTEGEEKNMEETKKTKSKPAGTKKRKNSLLDSIGKNYNDLAKEGKFKVIGREKEISEAIVTLNRLNKNNPVFIGEAGVGKTALAEAIATKIVEGDVPENLLNKEIISIDMASLVAGTGIRGQFEQKMKSLIQEVQDRGNVILFIDEIHMIVGAGAAEGSMDASNILKPALSRGEIQVIGATTLKEYRRIEKDNALERRFQPIQVNEPTSEETFEIVKGILSKYETHHNVSYSDEVVKQAIDLANKYMTNRFNPDKTIDLIDLSGSKVGILNNTKMSYKTLKDIQKTKNLKEDAVLKEDYILASSLRLQELELENVYKEQLESESSSETTQKEVTIEDIKVIIQDKTGIPVAKLEVSEKNKIKSLKETLSSKVVGQELAVDKISKAIRRSRAGLKSENRPTASFLFAGPTGVGKTEISRQLATEIFGTQDSMIRLDMSEFMEKHTVSKLIGAPPGYVGHEEAGGLTEKVRLKPYSIILLDEIEKAHPDVHNILLQVLEDGHLTDSHGKKVSFKETIIIATTNAGSSEKVSKALGFGAASEEENESDILDSLKPYFKPELLNRFDSIVKFNELEKDSLVQIVDLMLTDLIGKLEEKEISLSVTKDAKEKLAELGYKPGFGARPLRRVIQNELEDPITDIILDEEDVQKIKVSVSSGKLVVKKA